jgi:type II secretory pathway pseudopilin PulG
MLFANKIKAFTLTETLVALVLMVIIVGLASSIISITSSSLKMIKENESIYGDYEQMELILALDFSKHREFYYKDSTITIKNKIDSIQYVVTKNFNKDERFLIRNKDTLLRDKFNVNLYLHGNLVNQGVFDAMGIVSKDFQQEIFISKPKDLHQILLRNGF